MKERIFLLIATLLCILMIIYTEGIWYGKLMGILMFIGVWYVYDNLFKDVFNEVGG